MLLNFADEIQAAGRLLLGGAFIYAGLRNVQNRTIVSGLMSARGVPQASSVLWLGIVVQIIAGGLVVAGVWMAWAVGLLILFLLAATPMFHNFWDYQPGPDRAAKINGVVGNIALLGGLLTLLSAQA